MDLKKDIAIVGGLFLFIAFLLVFGKGYTSVSNFGLQNQSTPSSNTSNTLENSDDTIDLKINTLNVKAEIADSKKERQKGLSGRDNLAISNGMLFVFEKSDIYKIWMKEMKIPIDIIWISEDKNIVHIETGAEPQFDTDDDDLVIYTPKEKALYVLEINAGLSNANLLQLGDEVTF